MQGTTESAPSLSTDGVLLTGVAAIQIVVHAPVGQTFSGTGSLLGYVYSNGAWVRAPRSDLDLADVTGLQDGSLQPLPVVAAAGRFALVPSSVVLSGGTTITVDYYCTRRLTGEQI